MNSVGVDAQSGGNHTGFNWTWREVVQDIDESINLYENIRLNHYGVSKQPIFIDLIVRLLIAKSHIMSIQNKQIKALNLLN